MRPRPLPRSQRCGRCAPPRPLSGRATPPVRRGHASALEDTPAREKLLPSGPAPLRPLLRPPALVRSWLPPPATSCPFLPLKPALVSRKPVFPGTGRPRPRPSASHAHCPSQLRLGRALWIPAAPPPAVNSPALLSAAAPPLLARVPREPQLRLGFRTGKVEGGPTWSLRPLPPAAVPRPPASHALMPTQLSVGAGPTARPAEEGPHHLPRLLVSSALSSWLNWIYERRQKRNDSLKSVFTVPDRRELFGAWMFSLHPQPNRGPLVL